MVEAPSEPKTPEESKAAGRSPVAVAFFALIFISAFALFAYLFWGFATDFLLAFMFTGLFRPVYQRILPRVKDRPVVAASLTTALIAVVLAVPLGFLTASLSAEAAGFYNTTISKLTMERLNDFLFGEGLLSKYAHIVAQYGGFNWDPNSVKVSLTKVAGAIAELVYDQVKVQLSNVFAATFHFVLMLLIIFYMFIDGERLKRFIFETSPLPDDEEELLITKFGAVARATLFGNGVGSAVQGMIGGVSMAVVGLPSPILWGVVMTIFAFLPLVGVSVVTIPATIFLLLSGKPVVAILFFIFNTVQALFVENVIKTKLIGSHMQMHNLLIFLSIIGGLGAFGILGILYGPLIVALFLTLSELYHRRYKTRIMGVEAEAPD